MPMMSRSSAMIRARDRSGSNHQEGRFLIIRSGSKRGKQTLQLGAPAFVVACQHEGAVFDYPYLKASVGKASQILSSWSNRRGRAIS